MSELTDKQEKFVEEYRKTTDLKEAAERAGYSKTSPSYVKQDVLSSDAVQNALTKQIIMENFSGKLRLTDMQELALDTLRSILEDPEVKDRVKLSAVKDVLDRSEELQRKIGLDFGGEVTEKKEFTVEWEEILSDFDKDERKEIVRKLTRSLGTG